MSVHQCDTETAAQRIYEEQLHTSGHLDDSMDECSDRMDKTSSSSITQKKGYAKTRMSTFCHKFVKPAFPEAITDIKILHGMTALERRVKNEINDAGLCPEVAKMAQVRRGLELCPEERAFLVKRKQHVRDHFAKYLGLNPQEVHPDDVPRISFGGSGGGFRAMIGVLGYADEMKAAGLWACLTYVSGVSGSCWSLAAYYTCGNASMHAVIEHCKKRFSPYFPLSGDVIRTILSSPGGAKATLGPLVQKAHSGLQTVTMDLYSVFTTGWIFFQDDPATHPGGSAHNEVAGFQTSWHKFSSAREYIDNGKEPLPIITAIRHERPWRDWIDKETPFKESVHSSPEHSDAPEAWFQWFEFAPYEVGCDEIQAWVPTWAFGRPFENGRSTTQLPEQSLALLSGLATSAPAGQLTSYISTISRNLPVGFLGSSVQKLAHGLTRLWGKEGTEEFQNHHPLHACNEHNFMYHRTPVKPGARRAPGLENSPRIHLIDSGMDNNCPTMVLLHPQRKCDVMINMDASSDVQKDTFQNVWTRSEAGEA